VPLPPIHLHLDVLAVVLALGFGYVYAERVLRPLRAPNAQPATRKQWWSWQMGVLTILLSAGWPMHDLAEETLFTFHMIEHTIIGYLTPVLLLRGMPRWMADTTLGHPSVARWLRPIAHPVVGFFSFNFLIVFVHWPVAVGWQLQSEWTHLAMHALLFGAGLLLFLPIHSPTIAIPRMAEPMQMLYLFMNTIIPIVPASFLAFSLDPLYPMYGDGPASWGLSFQSDQAMAGIFMKLVGGFYLLGSIAAIWFRWTGKERSLEGIERELAGTGP
jgi:putative membrane protein